MDVGRRSWGMVVVASFLLTLVSPATAQYRGGSGTALAHKDQKERGVVWWTNAPLEVPDKTVRDPRP